MDTLARQDMIPRGTRAFLAEAGWLEAEIDPLPGDASFRRYFRVRDRDRKAMLMYAPPPQEDPQPFLDVANYLLSHDLRAPRILAARAPAGFVLLEDFGDVLMRAAVENGDAGREEAIYAEAVETLARLHRLPAACVPAYDMDEYLRETALFPDWFCDVRSLDIDRAGFDRAWRAVLEPLTGAEAMRVTVLRDYHAENIMLLDDGAQGLLDFQDARVGHPAYDLVSLLQDARRDVSPELEARMIGHYAAKFDPPRGFLDHYHVLGAQRNAKIVGIFTRLWKRDGKPRYLSLIPRVWRQMERDLAHPALGPVRDWFDANIPADYRDPDGVPGGAFAA